jgi:hypothetical protein
MSPADALDRLLQGRDVLDGLILSAAGDLLAGEEALHDPALDLLAASPEDADEIEVTTGTRAVYAARSEAHAVILVCRLSSLPSLVQYDLRLALSELGGEERAAA